MYTLFTPFALFFYFNLSIQFRIWWIENNRLSNFQFNGNWIDSIFANVFSSAVYVFLAISFNDNKLDAVAAISKYLEIVWKWKWIISLNPISTVLFFFLTFFFIHLFVCFSASIVWSKNSNEKTNHVSRIQWMFNIILKNFTCFHFPLLFYVIFVLESSCSK